MVPGSNIKSSVRAQLRRYHAADDNSSIDLQSCLRVIEGTLNISFSSDHKVLIENLFNYPGTDAAEHAEAAIMDIETYGESPDVEVARDLGDHTVVIPGRGELVSNAPTTACAKCSKLLEENARNWTHHFGYVFYCFLMKLATHSSSRFALCGTCGRPLRLVHCPHMTSWSLETERDCCSQNACLSFKQVFLVPRRRSFACATYLH